MSSGLLYVAIVGVWALVLVPMWLRRPDAGERSGMRLLSRRRRSGGTAGHPAGRPATPYGSQPRPARPRAPVAPEPSAEPSAGPSTEQPTGQSTGPSTGMDRTPNRGGAQPPFGRPPTGRRRARVIARRRRRLSGVCLLLIATVVLASTGVTPWWVIAPPVVLLAGYLALLRAARQIDAERRSMHAQRARTPAPADDEDAEVIPLSATAEQDELYDQYTDAGLRAVGD
ncbi:MAG: hypothetical protein GEV03_23990 [Streptosporangiales bacterium]|nr:hypothetical protein [Streptosporangiales bacterium]